MHTPGPWEVDDEEIYGLDTDGIASELIARIPVEYNEDELLTTTNQANARLIALAPEMLEELVHLNALAASMAAILHSNGYSAYYLSAKPHIDKAHALIAKITGD